jgi:hypothetical protein
MDELLRDFLTETAEGLDRVDSQLVRLEPGAWTTARSSEVSAA